MHSIHTVFASSRLDHLRKFCLKSVPIRFQQGREILSFYQGKKGKEGLEVFVCAGVGLCGSNNWIRIRVPPGRADRLCHPYSERFRCC
jgi:hypothetical protein